MAISIDHKKLSDLRRGLPRRFAPRNDMLGESCSAIFTVPLSQHFGRVKPLPYIDAKNRRTSWYGGLLIYWLPFLP